MSIGVVRNSLAACAVIWALAGCVGTPRGVQPVDGFEVQKYLGKWHEIARLNHSFEEGLQQVTATYSLRSDGGLDVLNKGFNVEKAEWQSAEGKAYFVEQETTAHLKVSFFGPFYSSYVVFELGDDYDYAFVSGPDKDHLWLLARKPQVPAALYQRFTERAQQLGFDISGLIRVDHSVANK